MTLPQGVRQRPPRTGAIIALVIGAILTVTGPVAGALAGAFAMIPAALKFGDSAVQLSPDSLVTLEADASVFLLAPVADLEGLGPDSCAVAGPGGAAVTVAFAPASALSTLVRGERYESFARVTATTAGQHAIACDTAGVPVISAPPLTSMIAALARWSIGGLAVSLAGVVLVIIGIVFLVRAPSGR